MKVYRVGGCVRDALLGLPIRDRDFVVVGSSPEEMVSLGFMPVGAHFPVFLHPETKEEYALARKERKTAAGHQGFAFEFSRDVSLTEDLLRRDFTINAMAEDEQGRIVDPYGGQEDLKRRLIRHVSGAFTEDPLRVFRAARFLSRFGALGFKIADETLALMSAMVRSGEIGTLSSERIYAETDRALGEGSPSLYFKTLFEVGALSALLPLGGLKEVPDFSLCDDLARSSAPRVAVFGAFARLLFSLLGPDSALLSALQRFMSPKPYVAMAQLVMRCQEARPFELKSARAALTLFKKTGLYRKSQSSEAWLLYLSPLEGERVCGRMSGMLNSLWALRYDPHEMSGLSASDIRSLVESREMAVLSAFCPEDLGE